MRPEAWAPTLTNRIGSMVPLASTQSSMDSMRAIAVRGIAGGGLRSNQTDSPIAAPPAITVRMRVTRRIKCPDSSLRNSHYQWTRPDIGHPVLDTYSTGELSPQGELLLVRQRRLRQ